MTQPEQENPRKRKLSDCDENSSQHEDTNDEPRVKRQPISKVKKSFMISDILGLNNNEDTHQNLKRKFENENDIDEISSDKNVKKSKIELLDQLIQKKLYQNLMPSPVKNTNDQVKHKEPIAPTQTQNNNNLLPAWIFCTRYSDRPSAGPRQRKKSKQKIDLASGKLNKTSNTENVLKKQLQQQLSSSHSTSSSSLSSSPPSLIIKQETKDDLSTTKQQQQQQHQQQFDNISNYDDCDDTSLIDDNCDTYSNTSQSNNNSNGSKRPRTAFTNAQLNRLKDEFDKCKYLTGEKRQFLANELNLNESQIKIWFQNKRAKIKKSSGIKNALALQLMAQGLYNHSNNLNADDLSVKSNDI